MAASENAQSPVEPLAEKSFSNKHYVQTSIAKKGAAAVKSLKSMREAFVKLYRKVPGSVGSSYNSKRQFTADFEFSSAAEQIQKTPPSPIVFRLGLSICSMVVLLIGISWFGRIDIYATASGRIQPPGRSKLIQPLYAGTIRRVFVTEGSNVKVGDPLLELDPTEADAGRNAAADHVAALDAEIARREAAIIAASSRNFNNTQIKFPLGLSDHLRNTEEEVFAADIGKLAANLNSLQAKIDQDLAEERGLRSTVQSENVILETLKTKVDMRENLQRMGWDTQSNVLDASEAFQREQATRIGDQSQLMQTSANIASLKKQQAETLAQFISDYTQALEKARNDVYAARQDAIKAQSVADYTRLSAPIDGSVQQLTVTTLGQVVVPGQQLMTIVPKNRRLEIEALVQSQDIGFVRTGQQAVIKVDAFPYTRYGTVSGVVTRVSQDSLSNEDAQTESDTQQRVVQSTQAAAAPIPKTTQLVFPVIVKLNSDSMMIDGVQTALTPGMSATVEIQTGTQQVISYLLSPFIEVQSDSFHER